MNPINNGTPTKDLSEVKKLLFLDKSTEFANIEIKISGTENKNTSQENDENVNKISNQTETTQNKMILNVQEHKGCEFESSKTDDKKASNSNNINSQSEDAGEKNTTSLNHARKQVALLTGYDEMNLNDEKHRIKEYTNKNTPAALEQMSDEEVEVFEDVEVPEEEVDEIIVPDDAEAEDLTDDKDNDDITYKSQHDNGEDEEDSDSKGSDMEENDGSLHGEETSKSSHTPEKDDDSDKKSLNNDSRDTIPKDYEDADNGNSPIESELVSLEHNTDSISEQPKSNQSSFDEDSTSQVTFDPLNCTGNKDKDDEDVELIKNVEDEHSAESHSTEKDVNELACQEEDDEVQFVETRNSPICIESDDDDCNLSESRKSFNNNNNNENSKQIIKTPTATVTVPQNITVKRTSARKSTAKPQQNVVTNNNTPAVKTQLQNKSRPLNYPQKAQIKTIDSKQSFTSRPTQHIVDCIDLLDSSDEESESSRNKTSPPQQKTLQKRTLLAAKGNYYKNNNTKTINFVTNTLPNKFPTNIRQQPKKPAPPPLPPPTPQSNFLNAVQLQPTAVSGQNPPAFSALLSNKNVIIPNAFYGNPPSFRPTPEMELERRYVRWLENFMNQFSKSQFVATHSCLVFLQRALKYKDFVRIKALRANMNNHAHSTSNQINTQLITELKTIFLKNTRKVTYYGRRFCELTCSAVPGKAVALMAHSISGKVTFKTCNMDTIKSTSSAASSTSSSPNPSNNTLTRKRQIDEDEDEYTPDKSKHNKCRGIPPSENGDEDSSEMSDDRKRSLRTKRTKRLDNSFSYNEDDLLAEYEIDDEDDEKLVHMEIQRKIEQKRLEAQKQRQQQVKSFESEFIQAFARIVDEPTTSSKTTKSVSSQRIRLKSSSTVTVSSIRQYAANNDAEDLLQATWIENVENDDTQIISDDDEPKVHRIYKQQQQEQQQDQQDHISATKMRSRQNSDPSTNLIGRTSRRNQEEIITGDDGYEENSYYVNNITNVDPIHWPKNIDSQMHVNGKHKDRCIICNLTCQRLVHHYVNEHRGCEVYNSRLSPTQLKLLKEGYCTGSNISLYKNGQYQYEAYCIFCQKKSRFMFPYWYQHFTMHTGEYAYRCTGCGMRKPTRSLLTQHQTQGCPEEGGVVQDYAHDSKSLQIEAKICSLCNYVQLHRSNIVKHLHTQHNIKQILPKHIQTIVLMKTSSPPPSTSVSSAPSGPNRRSRSSSSYIPNTYSIDDDDNDVTYEQIIPEEAQPQINTENHYYNYIPPYMQAAVNSGNFSFEDVDAGDDLSYMICGMLDVQMNPEAN